MGDLNDELIWNIIGKEKFCSYKFNTKTQNFCRNEFNITGFCSKQSCPISNSNYATIIEKNGEIYLYIKDTTNIRFPDKLWKRFKLSRNFIKSFQEIDLILNLWPKFFVFKSKQRLTKLWQMLLRDKLNKVKKKSSDIYKQKNISRDKVEEIKLIRKIKFENLVEKELLHRFNLGIYGKLYPDNFIKIWRRKLPGLNYSKSFIEGSILGKKIENKKTVVS